jgi:hypothetical protein
LVEALSPTAADPRVLSDIVRNLLRALFPEGGDDSPRARPLCAIPTQRRSFWYIEYQMASQNAAGGRPQQVKMGMRTACEASELLPGKTAQVSQI